MPFSPIDAVAVTSLPGIGRKTAVQLFGLPFQGSGPSDLRFFLTAAKEKLPKLSPPTLEQVEEAYESAHGVCEESTELEVAIIPFGSSRYPKSLESIPDPPAILYVMGDQEPLKARLVVAIVGTREPTDWGRRAGDRLAERMANAGFVVVSGLAHGCDTSAHWGCLRASGKTVAVLAHGLQMVYPADNRPLAHEIVERKGCLVSEYPVGMRGRPNYFVERDRLQSGLSQAVIVIETDVKGGTMHTVKACREQGRVLACLSHPDKWKHDPKTQGNQLLISEGAAKPLKDTHDVESLISVLKGDTTAEPATAFVSQPELFE